MSTLSAHLIDQMQRSHGGNMPPPHMMPVQTPQPPGGQGSTYRGSHYHATPTPLLQGSDSTQWGTHHGAAPISPWGMSQSYMPPSSAPGRFTQWSEERVATLQARLQRKLGPEYITQRPGPGGGPKLSYLEGWKAVNLANEVFGFNGWSSSIISLKTDFLDVNAQDRCSVGITAIMRITLQDGCFHEDLGYGHAENIRGKAAALEKAQKEAVTDGLKRAMKHFGNVLGNCLYDRDYTKEVTKVRVGPAKFNVNELERRPEFAPQVPTAGPSRSTTPAAASAIPQHISGHSKPAAPIPAPVQAAPPRHVREETPLRSVDDAGGDVFMDDSEFAFVEDESFFDDFDESVLGGRAQEAPMLVDAKSESKPGGARSAAPPPKDAAPYQHRHRPDMPVELPKAQSSAGSASSRGEDEGEPKKRIVGGFAFPGGQSAVETTAGSSTRSASNARAAAILAAATAVAGRAETPRIPSGGVDDVASRATTNLQVHSANLEIENVVDSPGTYGAFTSARGVKRDTSNSPTKSRLIAGGPRSALTDIAIPGDPGADWAAKRSRIM